MKYDVYAEFAKQDLERELEELVKRVWEKVKEDRRIKWGQKPGKLKSMLEKEEEVFRKFTAKFLLNNEPLCPSLYAKLQIILQNSVKTQTNDLIRYIHSVLQKDIKGYDPSRSPINELNLTEKPKNIYKAFISRFEISSEILRLLQDFIELSCSGLRGNLGKYMTLLKIRFTLRKPYISKDDENFYIIDNPVCKEKIFKVPYIRPTAWKGILRHVIRDILRKSPEIIIRLFGSEKESEEARQGRVFFYPTFFNRISLDVMTPLDRRKRAPVRGPILFEMVPEGTEGIFTLLYVPFDILHDQNKLKKEVQEDLEALKEAIPKMMLEYGFSAKRTSGYGFVEEKLIEVRVNEQIKREIPFEEFKNMMNLEIKKLVG